LHPAHLAKLVTAQLATAGSVVTQLTIPTTAALVGLTLQHQVAVLELGGGGSIQSITSSNALLLVLGGL
jgi:hypothetical protein